MTTGQFNPISLRATLFISFDQRQYQPKRPYTGAGGELEVIGRHSTHQVEQLQLKPYAGL